MEFNFLEILFRISVIYGLILLGSIVRSLMKDPDNSSLNKYLTKIILTIFFPYLVISSILNIDTNSFFIVFLSIFFCLVVIFSGFLSVLLYSHFRSIPDQTLGSMFLAVSFPNSVFLPFPLILILIGIQGLTTATLFAVTIIIIQNTLGSFLAIKYGSQDQRHSSLDFTKIIKKVLLFPPTLSMLVGFSLKIIFQPDSFVDFFSFLPFSSNQLNSVTDSISWISLIFALLLVGLTFNLSFSSLGNRFLLSTSFFRLIIAPIAGLLFLLIVYNFLFPLEVAQSQFIIPLIIQAFSGPAIINIAFSKEFSLDVESESVYITIITLFSLFILPFLVFLAFTIF